MDSWVIPLAVLFGSFVFLLVIRVPVAFSFLAVSFGGAFVLMGGSGGFVQVLHNLKSSVQSFTLLPLALFVLMGEVIFSCGVATQALESVDKWIGRVPGRLGLVAVGSGVLFAVLTGSSVASTALMGSMLTPEMEKRRYRKPMSLGPIMGSGCLAAMIPPSSMAIIIAVLLKLSVAQFLLAIIVPGLVMASLYAAYIILRCTLDPKLAPSYEVARPALKERIKDLATNILPIGFIIFAVTGVIFIGVATASEAAATGALACFIVAALYRKLNWESLQTILRGTLRVGGMVFLLLAAAIVFSGILAYSGGGQGLAQAAQSLPLSPMAIVILTQLVIVVLGCFMEPMSILMIVTPIYFPVMQALGVDLLWYGVILLINAELATISPPFGLGLFVMHGVAPKGTTMGDVYKAVVPFCILDLVALGLIMAFPPLALELPSLMLR